MSSNKVVNKKVVVRLYWSKFVKFTTFTKVSVILNKILTLVYVNSLYAAIDVCTRHTMFVV